MILKTYLISAICFMGFIVKSQSLPLQEIEKISGKINFLMFGNTMNSEENSIQLNCNTSTKSSANFTLPKGSMLKKAYLYWSLVIEDKVDTNVSFQGKDIVADRVVFIMDFFSGSNKSGKVFSATKNVTDILQQHGEGKYTLSNLGKEKPCAFDNHFAGWAVLVIYENPSENFNTLQIFEGLELMYVDRPKVEFNLENINIIIPEAQVGLLAWEGDKVISLNESFSINGVILGNKINPSNNLFNSTNSFDENLELWNMDLDLFDISSLISVGDSTLNISMTSDQDLILLNLVIANFNNNLPDATIVIDTISNQCMQRMLKVEFRVNNLNSGNVLPKGIPISFYANNQLLTTIETAEEIPVDGFISLVEALEIPPNFPSDIEIKASVDQKSDRTGIQKELDENNNDYLYNYTFAEIIITDNKTINVCATNKAGIASIDLDKLTKTIKINNSSEVKFYESLDFTKHPISGLYLTKSNPQIIYARFDKQPCDVTEIKIQVSNKVMNKSQMINCNGSGTTVFNLTEEENKIKLNNPNAEVSFYLNLDDAQLEINPINKTYKNIYNHQIIYARANDSILGECHQITEITLSVREDLNFTLGDNKYICEKDGLVSIEAPEGFVSYKWSTGEEGTNVIYVTQAGKYSLEVKNELGCIYSSDIEIIESKQPVVKNIEIKNLNATAHVILGLPPYTYSIDGVSFQSSNKFINLDGGLYELLAKDSINCESERMKFIVLNIPNIITPNKDGLNDEWTIKGLEYYPNATITIFDRYGRVIGRYKAGNYFQWKGLRKTQDMASDDYKYIIDLGNGIVIQGKLTQKRY